MYKGPEVGPNLEYLSGSQVSCLPLRGSWKERWVGERW